MHPLWQKVHHINNRLVPVALLVLLGLIVVELSLHIENPNVHLFIEALDAVVIAVFSVDLIFIAIKVRNVKIFFKHYWLDVLAVFPFFVLARFIRLFSSAELGVSQSILHESLGLERGAAEASNVTKSMRIGVRSMRLASKAGILDRFSRRRLRKSEQ